MIDGTSALKIHEPGMDFSNDQELAIAAIERWFKEWKTVGQVMTLAGYAGCLSGNTVLMYGRGTRIGVRPITMRDLYLKFNGRCVPGMRGISNRWVDLTVPTRLYSLWPNGSVEFNRVAAVFESGVKKVIRVTFDKGRNLVCTPDHPIAVPGGEFVKAGDLIVGGEVMARSTKRTEPGKGRSLKDRPPRVIVNTKYHPIGSAKTVVCNGISYEYMRVARSRLVVEAAMNGIGYDLFVNLLKHNPVECAKFKYLSSDVDVHHEDENTLNDTIGNLKVLTGDEHARIHAVEKNKLLDSPEEAKIVSIESAGEEMTYDIQMESPANNFSANGIFVHNTGKTTLIAHFVREWCNVAVAALCGKAAHVLRSKSVDAQTIHSLIYVPFENEEGKIRFAKRQTLDKPAQVIIIDEASMIDHLTHRDLLSFGKPVLFVGDHGQLEPIGTNPGLMKDPHVRLESIHRQAASNPIIRLATAFREGRSVPYWSDKEGRLLVTPKRHFNDHIRAGVQIICGFNKTRHVINAKIRAGLSINTPIPQVGEKIIFLKNNKEHGVFNGQQAVVTKVGKASTRKVDLEVIADNGARFELPCLTKQFGQNVIEDHKDQSIAQADFGYAVTAHKAQGSEWDDVLVLEEIASIWNPRRWQYTVATRAKERLVYCR